MDAPPETVFKASTDEKELVQWMPQEAKMDARVGGELEFKYHWADRGLDTVSERQNPGARAKQTISYTWDAETKDHQPRITGAVVTWVLDSLPDGKTRVTLIHSGVGKEFSQDTERGWSHYLSQLATYCKNLSS